MSERIDYLMTALDFFLAEGMEPADAWSEAVVSYAYVYHTDDGRLPIARAAEIPLQYMEKDK